VSTELLSEAFGRVREIVHAALEDATIEALTFRADPEANTMAWLIWHLTRVQDDHIAEVAGEAQVWVAGGWFDRFDLPFEAEAVHFRTMGYLVALDEADLARVVDASWNPPVTLGVRLVSILSDDLQHAGQASYLRGLTKRATHSTSQGPKHEH